jgi:hypothetical protein
MFIFSAPFSSSFSPPLEDALGKENRWEAQEKKDRPCDNVQISPFFRSDSGCHLEEGFLPPKE